jgi:hypothetical protein
MSYLPGLEPAVPPSLPDGDGDEWYTPRKVLDAVAALAADGIDLDPCYAPRSLVDARHVIDARSGGDGLHDSWPGDGLVWCNPPYSDVEPWLRRCCNASVSRDVVLLIPMRPETKAWQQWVWGSGAVVVIHTGRLSFVATDGTTPGGGMITTAFVTWSVPLALRLAEELRARGIDSRAVGVL